MVQFSNASLLYRSGLRLAKGSLNSSIHRVSWEQAFLPLASRQRGTAKLLVDGLASRIAEGVAALLLYVWLARAPGEGGLAALSASSLAYVQLAADLVWLGLTMVMLSRRDDPVGQNQHDPEPLDLPRGPDCCPIVAGFGARVQADKESTHRPQPISK
jgi:hypothetical protein